MTRIFKEICFVSTYFGNVENIDIAKNFKKHDEYDYDQLKKLIFFELLEYKLHVQYQKLE